MFSIREIVSSFESKQKELVSENKKLLKLDTSELKKLGLKESNLKVIEILKEFEPDMKEIETIMESVKSLVEVLQATFPPGSKEDEKPTPAQAKITELILSKLDRAIKIQEKPLEKLRQIELKQALDNLQDLPKQPSRFLEEISSSVDKTESKAAITDEIVLADQLVLNAGNPDEVKALIEKNPRLLFNVTQASNAAGMKVKGTLYQKALGSNDLEMADMLQKLLLAYDPEAEKKQRTEQFPLGWKEAAQVKLNEELTVVDKVIEKVIPARDLDTDGKYAALFEELKQFIELQNEKVLTSGLYSNLEFLFEANRRLENNIDKFDDFKTKSPDFASKGYWCAKACFYQIMVYGLIQAKMITPRDANEIIRGVKNFDENKPAPRTLKINEKFSYYDQPKDGAKLGGNFYLDIFGLPQISALQIGHGHESNPNAYNRRLFDARITALNTFCNEDRINQLRKEIPLKQMPISSSTDEAPKKSSDETLLVSDEAKKGVATFGTFSPKPVKEESTTLACDPLRLR